MPLKKKTLESHIIHGGACLGDTRGLCAAAQVTTCVDRIGFGPTCRWLSFRGRRMRMLGLSRISSFRLVLLSFVIFGHKG